MTEQLEQQEVATELTVCLKGEDSSYKQKFLLYDAYEVRPDDEIIEDCISQATAKFKGTIESVTIKILMHL